ncbi:hypothetical protein [Shewanella nanhaiensis]|uniref:DUF1877 family protein n=1 Tax=Shewanella nanhaiensis TaxID=2864872 RepID=A0ABS7E1T5_9GAMM|nr:hypothetical protein [Shewanella nanhaiensis]MBW8183603.1 hypothetical protein [Shewanella nanhaiensis]
MSVDNSFMIVEWNQFSSEYTENSDSDFLIELRDELDDYPNSSIIKNEWFEYLQLNLDIESADYTGSLYEPVEEAKSTLTEDDYLLLKDVIGILNVDLTDPHNDLKLADPEYWIYSSYSPDSSSAMLKKIEKLSTRIDEWAFNLTIKEQFSSFCNEIKAIFSKAVSEKYGVLIAVG